MQNKSLSCRTKFLECCRNEYGWIKWPWGYQEFSPRGTGINYDDLSLETVLVNWLCIWPTYCGDFRVIKCKQTQYIQRKGNLKIKLGFISKDLFILNTKCVFFSFFLSKDIISKPWIYCCGWEIIQCHKILKSYLIWNKFHLEITKNEAFFIFVRKCMFFISSLVTSI